ncbi:LAMI_0G16710g1_1 [Lachancea mirantina]|uniref:LAMI_0G16710g1_1 n=1 Tax=Lachancea mirantina TaxID=1230905 RepID=A0A1G4KCP1_9SACH|nr:LAMI_0G16710g1_1 [Lachancea mirantina]
MSAPSDIKSELTFSGTDSEFLSDSVLGAKSPVVFEDDEQAHAKLHTLLRALRDGRRETVAQLGASDGGFLCHTARKKCWLALLRAMVTDPALLTNDLTTQAAQAPPAASATHPDEHQISLDVKRSFCHVPDSHTKQTLRTILEQVLVHVIRKHSQLRYYQGFHDVVAVFVVVFYCGDECGVDDLFYSASTSRASSMESSPHPSTSSDSTKFSQDFLMLVDLEDLCEAVEMFALLFLRDFMMSSLDFTIEQLKVIPLLIAQKDADFHSDFQLGSIDPFFAISSILTLFSHDLAPSISDQSAVVFQIFDLVISTRSMLAPLCLYANIVVGKKQELVAAYESNLSNFDNTTDLTHAIIQQVVNMQFEPSFWLQVLEETRGSLKSVPKCVLEPINKYSVLVTSAGQQDDAVAPAQVAGWILKQIKFNQLKVAQQSKGNLDKRPMFAKWIPLIKKRPLHYLKFSIALGIAAILLKLYIQYYHERYPHSLIPYLEHLKSFKFLGLDSAQRPWIDPLKSLLKLPAHISGMMEHSTGYRSDNSFFIA